MNNHPRWPLEPMHRGAAQGHQCIIFDGNGKDAKFMGVEYLVSRGLFESLSAVEKKRWPRHVHAVQSGQLMAPGLPQVAEHALMEKMIGTYGKAWHTGHTDQQLALPLGHPVLMMGFTVDGPVNEAMVAERAERAERMGVRSADKRRNRESIPAPAISPGADAWQQGEAMQIALRPLAQGAAVVHAPAAHPEKLPAR